MLINLIALVGGTALLEDLLVAERAQPLVCAELRIVSSGVFMAVRLSTTEALAYGLVIAAIWFERRDQLWSAAILLALAGLAKETNRIVRGRVSALFCAAPPLARCDPAGADRRACRSSIWQIVLVRLAGRIRHRIGRRDGDSVRDHPLYRRVEDRH